MNVGMSGVSPAMATPSGVTAEQERRRPRWQVAVAAVLVLIAAAIAWQALSPLGDQAPVEIASTLDSNRIAVGPFVNRTGDASLDGLASMTADRLTQGLADLTEIDVAPGSVVAAASAGAGSNLQPYLDVLDQFLAGVISERQFEYVYTTMFRDDASLRSREEVEVLGSIFGDVDRHMTMHMMMAGKGPDEALRARAEAAYARLKEIASAVGA